MCRHFVSKFIYTSLAISLIFILNPLMIVYSDSEVSKSDPISERIQNKKILNDDLCQLTICKTSNIIMRRQHL